MKKRLEAMLSAKSEQRKNLVAALVSGETAEERKATNNAIEALDREMDEIRSMIAACDTPVNPEQPSGAMSVVGSQMTGQRSADPDLELRKAFKNFIATGDKVAYRSAAGNTTTGDYVGTVIPENLVNQIIEKIEHLGVIYNLVTKTAFPVGQTIPREATKPVATWVGRNTTTLSSSTSGEGNGSTPTKTILDTTLVFAHFKLRVEVAMTEEVSRMTLAAFEALFVKNVSTAILRAKEFAIVDGDGYGMPTGILANNAPSGQALEVSAGANNKLTYKLLCDAEAAIPQECEAGAKWCMTKKTFMEFVGMVDSNGQPIARINYGINGKPERTLLGRDVIIYVPQTGSHIGNYADTVSADTLFAFIFDFADYVLNENYDLGIQHKVDWDNEDHLTKAVCACDGKAINLASLVTLTKKH